MGNKTANLFFVLICSVVVLALSLKVFNVFPFSSAHSSVSTEASSQPDLSEQIAALEKKVTKLEKENQQLQKHAKPTEEDVVNGQLMFYLPALWGVYRPLEINEYKYDEVCIDAQYFFSWFNNVNRYVQRANNGKK